jgi:hypothetical protein
MSITPKNKVLMKIPPRLDTIIDDETKLQIGQKFLRINKMKNRIIVDKSIKTNVIFVSRHLLTPNKQTSSSNVFHSLNYQLMPNKIIKAGPVVGVLIAGKKNGGTPPVARRARIYHELSQKAAEKNIFLYFFNAYDVDWNHQKVTGLISDNRFKKNEMWAKSGFFLPDIVYNRISFRFQEQTETVKDFMMKARNTNIHVFNSRFLNKWEVHQSLVNHPQSRDFTLETDLYSKEALVKYLNKYKEFFLKPVASSIGRGIIKVICSRPDKIEYFRLGKSSDWQICRSAGELFHHLSIPKEERYILQKGISLATIDKRVFDIRAQVQKNGQGLWRFTGAAVRLAASGKFVTHVPNGGSKRDYYATIKEVFGSSESVIQGLDKQLKSICRTVPQILEESLGIHLAVLSMDIGIDQDGHMWVIEVNSKPASFDEDVIRKRHLDLLTDYFLYKSNFDVQ